MEAGNVLHFALGARLCGDFGPRATAAPAGAPPSQEAGLTRPSPQPEPILVAGPLREEFAGAESASGCRNTDTATVAGVCPLASGAQS